MQTTIAPAPRNVSETTGSSSRFLSLDVFRGLTVAGMILVNTPGSWEFVYPPLRHAPWNGCTPTDLVFPFFLFAVGNAMSFSMNKYQQLGNASVVRKIFTRAALIFAIGLFLNWFPFVRWNENELVAKSFENLRIFGVLQRIALAYLGGALIVHFFNPVNAFRAAILLLFAYWMILLGFGNLTLEGNAVRKLDQWLLADSHLYKGYFSSVANENIPFDPEGLLSSIAAIASVIFGFLVSKYIKENGNSFETIAHLMVVAMISIFVALCWDMTFPINKPIWTSSYVFYTTGIGTAVLCVILFFTELKGYEGWTKPFVLFGKNPLFIYALSGMLVRISGLLRVGDNSVFGWLYSSVFQPIAGDYNGSLLFAICYVLLLLSVAWVMDKRKVYIRV